MILNAIGWVVCGLIVGLIARAIVPGRQNLGILLTIVLGIVGAIVGGFISSLIFGAPTDPNSADVQTMWPGWIMSIVGGVLVLWGYVALTGYGRSDRPLVTR